MDQLITFLLVLFAPIILILLIVWLFLYGLWIDLFGWLLFRNSGENPVPLGESFTTDLRSLDPCLLGESAGSHYEPVSQRMLERVLEETDRSGRRIERIVREELVASGCGVSPLRLRRVVMNLRHRAKQDRLV